jgi:hypothetical protein
MRESMFLTFRVDELAVAEHVELAGPSRSRGRVEPLVGELGGETRRPFVVAASGRAIEDLDAHVDRA